VSVETGGRVGGKGKSPPWKKAFPARTEGAKHLQEHSKWNGLFKSQAQRREFELQERQVGIGRIMELVDDWAVPKGIPAGELAEAIIAAAKKHPTAPYQQKTEEIKHGSRQRNRKATTIAPHAVPRRVATETEARALLD